MLVVLASSASYANVVAVTVPSYTNFANGAWTLGFEFSPTVNIDVTALGSYFPSGATDTHGVSIWDASGNVLATATVNGNGTEGFDFTSMSLALTGGVDNFVGGTTLADNYAIGTPVVNPLITYLGHFEVSTPGVTPGFPTNGPILGFDDFGGNFTFNAVPEPGTWAMILQGFVGLGLMYGRTGRKAAVA
jgi:hypothetical protein